MINNVFVNVHEKQSVEITSSILGNEKATDLLMDELNDVYDELFARNVYSDYNEFNGVKEAYQDVCDEN